MTQRTATVPQSPRAWAQGARDGFHGRPPREGVTDALAYSSGRIEGAAWREQGRELAVELRRARLPYAVAG